MLVYGLYLCFVIWSLSAVVVWATSKSIQSAFTYAYIELYNTVIPTTVKLQVSFQFHLDAIDSFLLWFRRALSCRWMPESTSVY